MSAPRLRVLVADDERLSRRLVTAALSKEFDLKECEDGQEAVDAFTAFQPDAVLLDVDMPRKDGVTTAKELKQLAGSRFVPIFLVSGLEEQATLIRGLNGGADDFLPKPFNVEVFRPKLAVFMRLQEMQRRLQQQNDELERYRKETQTEHHVATQVFDKMMQRGSLADPRVRVLLSPLSIFNGDAALANVTPDGRFRLLVADGTGHGLSAALGTMPLTTLFHTATSRGETLEDTARALNAELKSVLPAQLFSTAVLLEVDRERGQLSVLNAGMPDVYLRGHAERRFASQNVPLGISRSWEPVFERVEVQLGDRVYAMSDGVVEAADSRGKLFGPQRVAHALSQGPLESAFDRLLSWVKGFSGHQSDDLSLIELTI